MIFEAIAALVTSGIWLNKSIEKSNKDRDKKEYNMRKTFSKLEIDKICDYVEQGYDLEKACNVVFDEMIELGYSPCMHPRDFKDYKPGCDINKYRQEGLWGYYDSDFIKYSNLLYKEYKKDNPDLNLPELTEEMMYSSLPSYTFEYDQFIDFYYDERLLYSVGDIIEIPGYGHCKIVKRYREASFGAKTLFGVFVYPSKPYYDVISLKDGKKIPRIYGKTKGIAFVK